MLRITSLHRCLRSANSRFGVYLSPAVSSFNSLASVRSFSTENQEKKDLTPVAKDDSLASLEHGVNYQLGHVSEEGLELSHGDWDFKIMGTETQLVEVTLHPGAACRVETGSLLFMTGQYPCCLLFL